MRSKLVLFFSVITLLGKQATCLNINTQGVTTVDYANFGAGLTISSFVELAANTPKYPCVTSVAGVLSNVYMIMFYYGQY